MKIFEIVVSSALFGAVAGGVVSYFVAQYSLKAADLASRIDELCNDNREMERIGCAYWQLDPTDPKISDLEMRLRGISKRMGKRLKFLAEKYWVIEFYALDEFISVRHSIMLYGFEEKGRSADPSRYEAIQEAVNNFETALRRAKTSIR